MLIASTGEYPLFDLLHLRRWFRAGFVSKK